MLRIIPLPGGTVVANHSAPLFSLIPLDNDNNAIHICIPTIWCTLNFLALHELDRLIMHYP
jgi:hypothetical protein